MNMDTFSLQQSLQQITRILLIMSVIGFCHSAVAADVVTDDQIRRVAKIARATKTDISVTKERVTVTVHGVNGKKMAKRVKKIVGRIMRQGNYSPKQVSYSTDVPDFQQQAPVLNNTRFRPPPTLNNSGNYRQPPALDFRGSTSHPPSLNDSNANSSDYY